MPGDDQRHLAALGLDEDTPLDALSYERVLDAYRRRALDTHPGRCVGVEVLHHLADSHEHAMMYDNEQTSVAIPMATPLLVVAKHSFSPMKPSPS